MRMGLLAALAITLGCAMHTRTLGQDQSPGSAAVFIHAGKLIDRPGKPPRGPTTIVVENDRIVEVRGGFATPDRPDARVIDLSSKTVLPGLIDCHVHLSVNEGGSLADQLEEVSLSPAAKAFQAQTNGMKTLRAGFTTVRNLSDPSGATLALRDAIAAGSATGPRIVDAGRSISVTGGHMDRALGFRDDLRPIFDLHQNTCDGADDCRRAARVQVGRGADVIKFATTGGVTSRTGSGVGQQMFEDEARAIVATAHMLGRKVAVHAHGADGVRLALAAGADSIEHATILDEALIAQWAKSSTYYVPTLSVVNGVKERLAARPQAYPPAVLEKMRWRIEVTGQSLRRLVPRGVRIAFGTDAGISKHGRNADEFEMMVASGMTPTGALVAATVNAADLLGLSKEIGTIEPGKSADLIAVSGNPLVDVGVLKRVEFVMARGRVVD